ncbi:hypothetical protein Y024_1327 [Burkholderia pseudomallei TSV44]|nr:hypothetical protein Y024_1327 [Burkholderia pseudomallei TSV44]
MVLGQHRLELFRLFQLNQNFCFGYPIHVFSLSRYRTRIETSKYINPVLPLSPTAVSLSVWVRPVQAHSVEHHFFPFVF